MKKIIPIALSVISLFFLVSCEKTVFKRKLQIEVTDSIYGKPIAGCQIKIYQDDGKGFPLGTNYTLNSVTDENGHAEFEFKPYRNKDAYDIKINAEILIINYYKGIGEGQPLIIGEKKITHKDLNLLDDNKIKIFSPQSPAFLMIHCKNTNPFDENDFFQINLYYKETIINYGFTYHGTNINETLVFPLFGDKDITLKWKVIKNNIEITDEKTIYCKAFYTTNDTIAY